MEICILDFCKHCYICTKSLSNEIIRKTFFQLIINIKSCVLFCKKQLYYFENYLFISFPFLHCPTRIFLEKIPYGLLFSRRKRENTHIFNKIYIFRKGTTLNHFCRNEITLVIIGGTLFILRNKKINAVE